MKGFTFGKTRILIYGGLNTIGGNCVVIQSPSLNIMLDQGLNFSQLKRYYGLTIQPSSVEELRRMRVLPPRKVYEDVEEVYISHPHLDHLGSLNIPRNVATYLPSRDVVEAFSRSWWFGWKQHLLPQTLSFRGFKNVRESRRIKFAKVSHSAFPSYAFRVDTDDTSILYTGDLRLEPLHPIAGKTTEALEMLAEDRIDILIIEGTNFSRKMNYITPQQFKVLLESLLERYSSHLLFISTHPLDLEAILTTIEILRRHDYLPIFENYYYAQLLDKMIAESKYSTEEPIYFMPRKTRFKPLENFETVYSEDLKDYKKAVFVPTYAVNVIKEIANTLDEYTVGTVHIIVSGEPLGEEWIVEEKKIANWLALLGITSYRIHVSGHYHPHEFEDIIRAVKPKNLIPIHTKAPKTMLTLFEKHKKPKAHA